MAEAIPHNLDIFTCPICLDLLKNPVTLNCGHNYCMGCINGCWDQEDQKEVYSCPQCRQTFTPRPVLNKNNIVAELVEQILKTRIQTPLLFTVETCAGLECGGEVECDLCSVDKLKAVKSCLDCVLSYCEAHYKVHNYVNPRRKHKVIDANVGQSGLTLQERICTKHEKHLEVFCRTDQTCVCVFCMIDEHKGHDTVPASVAKMEKQVETQRSLEQRIQKRETQLQGLTRTVENLKSSAQIAVEDRERMFTEMIRSIERRRSEVTELIRAQEEAEVSWAEGLLRQLEQEIVELKRRGAELARISLSEDNIHFLKTFQSLSELPESKDLSNITFNHRFGFEIVNQSISLLSNQLEDLCKQEVRKISADVNEVKAILPPEPSTREEFLQYSCNLTLDLNTANRHLSERNRIVESTEKKNQSYPDHPERFDSLQVLCREGVSGRCYWEVEWSGKEGVDIAVSYKSIARKGCDDDARFGYNNQSWSLDLRSSDSIYWHNNEHTTLPLVASSRIGVYVDHRAGTLAFYSISDTMTLLHRVQTTFSQTLYPGFYIDILSSVKLL